MDSHIRETYQKKNTLTSINDRQNHASGAAGFHFTDNRPEMIAQRKLYGLTGDNWQSQEADPVQKKENMTGLPDNLKAGIENISGQSMDDVKVHYNSSKPAQLNAHAYAQGNNIHLASGQEKHLPHEAWHVVQQKQGRVKPTMQMKGHTLINDDVGLEKEADVMGQKAVQFVDNRPESKRQANIQSYYQSSTSKPVQRLAIRHGIPALGGWVVYAYATLAIPGAAVTHARSTSGPAGHAEGQLIAWATAQFPGGVVPAGTVFEIWVSASPCSSVHGTSGLPVGCMQQLQAFAAAGVNVIVHADHPYQPAGAGMKAASVGAAGAMAAGPPAIPIDFSKRTGVAAGLAAYPVAGGLGHALQPAHGTVAQLSGKTAGPPSEKETEMAKEHPNKYKKGIANKPGKLKIVLGP